MGRPLRTKIDFAKTISWYDFFYNQLVHFGRYKNDYDMEKFFYGYPEIHDVKSLFKKYKLKKLHLRNNYSHYNQYKCDQQKQP